MNAMLRSEETKLRSCLFLRAFTVTAFDVSHLSPFCYNKSELREGGKTKLPANTRKVILRACDLFKCPRDYEKTDACSAPPSPECLRIALHAAEPGHTAVAEWVQLACSPVLAVGSNLSGELRKSSTIHKVKRAPP